MIKKIGISLLGRFFLILVLVMMELGVAPVQVALAATLTVTNSNDSGPGSLRQAIADAGTGDVITFDPSLAGGTIALTSQLYIDKNLTIDGSGLDPQLILSGGYSTRILEVVSPAQVTLSHLWFTDGQSTNGGAIYNTGNLTIDKSTFSNNSSSGGGGAISGAGILITDSTFMNNAASDGGVIYSTFGPLEIYRSTMVHNQATMGSGGAIRLAGNGEAVIVNSTITENSAADDGGAISIGGVNLIHIANSTFARNTAISGAEIKVTGTSSNLQIINSVFVCASESVSCYEAHTPPGMTNSILGAGTLYDFGLAALADNGGPTQTMALLPGSPLIDAGTFTECPATDQRGVARPKGSYCDIGAYEDQTIVRYVKPDADGSNDGTSWANAYTDLQTALAATFPDEEIWVAAGIYKPTATPNRNISFNLHNGVALYGGFAGGETSLAQRDPVAHPTILSGDIGSPNDNSDNSYHVVVGSGTNNSAILDGFIVQGGNANGASSVDRGGGIYTYNGEPLLANTTFENNSAYFFGGGVYYGGDYYSPEISSHIVLKNLIIKNNSAAEGAGLFTENHIHARLTDVVFDGNTATRAGGGMEDRLGILSLTNVVFKNNTADGAAGGMQNFSTSASLTNVTFSNNTAVYYGGGLVNGGVTPILTNVTFYGNSAEQGGGIWNSDSKPVLTNVTFYNNSASTFGGAIYSDTAYSQAGSETTLQNAILWGNTAPTGAQIYNSVGSTAIVSDSVVQGGFAGGTNIITTDPLLGALGNYGGFTQTIPLQSGSSAIDAGNDANCPAQDQRGVTRPKGSHCDIGAYEYEDLTPPTVLSIARAGPNPSSASTVSFTVTFSENVINVGTEDFSLLTTGVSGAGIASVSGSGASYTVIVNAGSGNGTIHIDLIDDDSIKDLANFPLGGAGTGNGNYTGGETYDILWITISGNADVAGATLSYTDGSQKTITADGNGDYSLTVPYNWLGTVTPSKAGYTFTPPSRPYSNVTVDQLNQNYSAIPVVFTISGNVDVAGVTLDYTDGSPKQATTDSNGDYSFTVSYNWSGIVTPSKAGYTFSPVNKTYSNVTADQAAQDYTATAITYTISGNAGVSGATLSYTDGTPKTATADGSGNYSFTVSYNWSGTVIPSKTAYSFSPPSRTYSSVLSNKPAQNFGATLIPPPSAQFDAWPLIMNINEGTTTQFHIVDTSNISTCSWDYGDGSATGTSCSPYHPHTYADPGSYTVSLTVTGPGGSDSSTLTRYITVNPTLVVTKTGEGIGTVISSPAGINCGSSCSGSFAYQAVVTLTANASAGSTFVGWSGGGCSGTDPCTINMESTVNVSAHFETIVAICPSITGWKGEYWVNPGLSGSPVVCRDDASIDFDWGSGTPDPNIPPDHFSAKWTRTVNLSAGSYLFHIDHDDGVRLYIDDMVNPVLNKWDTCCVVDTSAPITLSDGDHVIRVEYYENNGEADVRLWWEKVSPDVTSITRADPDPVSTSSVRFNVTFSENVTNVDAADLKLTTTGITGASIVGVAGSGAARTVTVNTGTGNGTIRLDVMDNDTILNGAGFPLGGTGTGNGNYAGGEVYTVRKDPTFADVPTSHPYYHYIEILYANRLTSGCQANPPKFCPDKIMNRAEAAAFNLRANFGPIYVPPAATHIFVDDWTKGPWGEPWAEGMKLNGYSAGCQVNPPKYCPWEQIPREQAVIFALKIKYGKDYTPPPATGTLFADMTNTSFYATAWAEQAYREGLIPNCGMSGGKPKICPKTLVSRGLAAYMIVRAKNLTMP